MSKRKWHTKAIYLGVALALCLGLTMVPAVAGKVVWEEDLTVTLTGDPTYCWTPLNVTFNATASGGIAPYTYTFNWNYQYKQWADEGWKAGDHADLAKLFGKKLQTESVGPTTDTSITKTHEFTIPGYYEVQVGVTDSTTGTPLEGSKTFEIRTVGILPSPIAYDVKGSTQQIEVKGVNATAASITWWLEAGVELGLDDVTLTVPAPDKPDESGNFTCTVKSMKKGDIHIYAKVNDPDCKERTLHTEKKWGELDHTTLDVDASTTTVEHTKTVIISPEATSYSETLKDMVYATFYEVPGTPPVGDAIVHWWLFEEDAAGANQQFINDLMDYLASQEGAKDDNYWAAHGKYVIDDLDGKQPFDYIDDYADTHHADETIFSWTGAAPAKLWYIQNTTEDSFPAEVRGRALATLEVDPTKLTECEPVTVMIVVLVSYPGGSTPQEDPFNGENIVCLEKGKKTFHRTPAPPPPTQVKVPQVRWAGEKIVLEKDWGEAFEDNLVMFALEEGSIGDLIPVYAADISDSDSRTVFTTVDSHGIARAMFKTEQQGQVDVECVLYNFAPPTGYAAIMSFDQLQQLADTWPIVGNHGFLVYYLALESLELNPLLPDPSPVVDEDAEVTVQVRGWFTSDALPGSGRDALPFDVDGDGFTDITLPADRYVLPDDWPILAGNSMERRPQYDLMDNPTDAVTATAELGPYDGDVRTPTVSQGGPEKAEAPCIGPFNTLQPWSSLKMWIATASVPADYTVATPFTAPRDDDDVRNTVVPNGELDWFDCPMPQGLVIFNVATSSLSKLDKGTVLSYGVDATDRFITPFYAVEIPSHEFIPLGEYLWDSWGRDAAITDGPYDYWGDLSATPITTDPNSRTLEVYCDNHGIAGVTIDALDEADTVTLTVTADFPYLPCKYWPITREIDVTWSAASSSMKGDFDNDGDIDFYDFAAFGAVYGSQQGAELGNYDSVGDFDDDGDIDFYDFAAFGAVYGYGT